VTAGAGPGPRPADAGSAATAAAVAAVEVTVRLPRSLQALFPGCPAQLEARGATMLEVIADLDRQVPGLRNRILDAGPELRRHLNLFVDSEIADLTTPLHSGAAIRVVPAVSGGSGGRPSPALFDCVSAA
jgi:molybdopterin synthase sulfur carrier subunit